MSSHVHRLCLLRVRNQQVTGSSRVVGSYSRLKLSAVRRSVGSPFALVAGTEGLCRDRYAAGLISPSVESVTSRSSSRCPTMSHRLASSLPAGTRRGVRPSSSSGLSRVFGACPMVVLGSVLGRDGHHSLQLSQPLGGLFRLAPFSIEAHKSIGRVLQLRTISNRHQRDTLSHAVYAR